MADEILDLDAPPKPAWEPQLGDQVHLKGGQSWNMTVVGTAGKDGKVKCAWHDRNGTPLNAEYPPGALNKN